MARRKRFASPECLFHVVNRGNDRRTVFHRDADFSAFLALLRSAGGKFPVHVFGYCAMPNHFHLLVRPEEASALSAYMQWVTCRYACDLRRRTDTVGHGHVFQRRFWSTPVHDQLGLLTVLRYIEANPVRARLVDRAEDWLWSSLRDRRRQEPGIVRALPVGLPANWDDLVNFRQRDEVLKAIRDALVAKRGRPACSNSH